jgi:uncharacterized protein (UPF0332 family)
MNFGFYDKAKRGIADAEMLFDAGRYDAAANRAYYACFYVAIALLGRFGIEHKENPHSWVQAQFSAEIVHRRKLFPRTFASALSNVRSVRHTADYSQEALPKSTAMRQLKEAQSFYNALSAYLEKTP